MLTAKFPSDLISTGDDPCVRNGIPNEDWRIVPHDWTSFGDISKWLQLFRGDNAREREGLNNRASTMIRQYYLHQLFGTCFAQENHDRHGDCNTARTMLFAYAEYYLKFHGIPKGGWFIWVHHTDWIRETYWRINAGKEDLRSTASIIGPSVYRSSMRKSVCDLSIFEEQFSEDDQDDEEKEEAY
ncbi:hypothetical protein AZE42_07367 [Rhizopogon vesiculosus]|uniref:Uncharacterized protein n=1 Tax=Rhizopogon vesiculosus TaxID=180088 RepID=A0A1J8Q5E1_9AGAM|nr:hypothetical protein AZE42_07367 [Rhizopogon vesiculosus]